MQHQPHNWITAVLPFVILAAVIAFRMRSMSKERPLNIGTLWIVPAVYLVLAASMIFALPPPPIGWGLAGLGLGLGAALGWHRAKLIRIHRDEQSGALRQKASPLAMILLAALVALKLGARAIFGESAVTQPGSSAMLLTDAFLGFALGLLTATRVELYLRGRRLLEAA